MSSNRATSTSMASVWDTLNKMKARQAKAESRTPRQHTTHRRDAIGLFEREVSAAARRGETDGRGVLMQMREIMDTDEHVRAVVDEHRQRVLSNPAAEVAALKKAVVDIRDELALASAALRRANDIAHKMKLELPS